MLTKWHFKGIIIVLLIALTTLNISFATSTVSIYPQFFMKEIVNGNKEIAYLALEANLPSKTLASINKTLYIFYTTANTEMTHTSSARLMAYADHHVIGNLGVFSSGGTTYTIDTEKTEWKKNLHLNLTNNHSYGLKDLFKSNMDYKKEIAALLTYKNDHDPNRQMPINASEMITDTNFEILPEGVKFFQVVKIGHVSQPYQYFSLTLQWYELDNLVNKKGELWQVIKESVDTSPLHPVSVTMPEGMVLWGYANAQNRMIIPAQYETASKFDHWGFARVTSPSDPQVAVLIDQRNKTMGKFHRLIEIASPTTAIMYTMDDIIPRLVTIDTQKVLQRNVTFYYSEGVVPYSLGKQKDDRFGYVDRFGKVTISARYLEARPFFNGKAIVKLESGKYALINHVGKVMKTYNVKVEPCDAFNSVLIYQSKGKYGAISIANKSLLSAKYLWLRYVPENGQFIVTTSKGNYLADMTGKRMTEYYRSICYRSGNQYEGTTFKDELVLIKGNGQYKGPVND